MKKYLTAPLARVRALFKNKKAVVVSFFLLFTSYFLLWIFWDLPLPTSPSLRDSPVSTKILDRNGKLIYEVYADKRRTPISLSEIPRYVKEATIAIEDKDFYKHRGFSITGIARAFYNTLLKNKLQGGSTLTQQLVKNTLLSSERTVRRKAREMALTIIIETIYSKDKILEMYLNQIPYGGTAYGIEAASQLYFAKRATDLTLPEAAFLAGLPAAPSRYSPFGAHPELAKERQKIVAAQMSREGFITENQQKEIDESILSYAQITPPKAPHFALWVKEELSAKYGEAIIEKGGLRVTTTLDLDLQEFAEKAVSEEVAKLKKQKVGNGAAIVTNPATGEILAMVGSKDYFATDEDGKVNVVLAKRQPGSAIKPLTYALALRDGKITPATTLADVPTCFSVFGQPAYCPTNYDGSFHGGIQVRFALGNSYNIPAVRVLAASGVEGFVDFVKKMGLSTLSDPDNYGLSLTLGGGEVRPIDMAEAFGVFANAGIKQPPVSILKIVDWKDQVLEEKDISQVELSGERVLSPEVAFLISHILLDNNARSQAFGERSYLNVSGHSEVSVKTGTTNDRRDNWTVGYTKDVAALVWVGNNDNTPMSGAVSGVSGASPIWNRIMKEALEKHEKGGHGFPKQPGGIIGKNVCSYSDLIPEGCSTRFEYFLEDSLPSEAAQERQDVQIDKTTGALAGPETAPEQIETQNHPILKDPLGTIICLDCPLPTWSTQIRYPL